MTFTMFLVSALTCIAMDFLGGVYPDLKPHARPVPVVQAEK